MQGIFDTHCHLMSEEYKDEETALILEDAKFSGVKWFNNVGYDIESSKKAIQAANEFDFVYATIGIHPTDVARYGAEDLKDLDKLLNNSKVIAVGEIGLDYYHKHVSHDLQKEWFIKQLHLAKKHDLPVAIHCRDAYEECLHILKTEKITKGLMHCYSGDVETAKKFLDLGFYISFSGTVTFKNANQLREVAKMVPLDKILVETDAPYLTPDPYRGQKNYPKYIAYTVAQIAKIKDIPVSEMIRITTKNALKVFNIKE
ncbi:Mg-dependent DNase [Spiroplasma syrphidicola EA-1]|uniref:Mg-dependent DNase n=1 Tax=Spiroplasma syrphidicola EA-1 TaxID=1276229 RepID=R4U537_9MOLU|nr:TatD family hydrolase [Spiroplasma syrphidicola]AGM26597.1 Mg-dependent DNase [Spiroplasma syrphidicola EA-1]